MFFSSRLFSRSNHYVPLDAGFDLDGKPISRRRSPRHQIVILLVTIVALAGVILLTVIITRNSMNLPPRPLDDFQHLNRSPLVQVSSQENGTAPGESSRRAFVTTLYTDKYAPAILTLGHSLRKTHTTARLIVLYFPAKVSASALCLAVASGFEAVPVSRIPPPRGGEGVLSDFLDQFTKLSLWKLDRSLGLEGLVYLDADTLVLQNIDELFSLPYAFAAAPDVWSGQRGMTLEFNAGVMYLKPNATVYQHMIDVLPDARFPMSFAEQAFLNQYFAAHTLTLPPLYNGNLMTKNRFPTLWAGMQDDLRVMHYNMAKPFVGRHRKQLHIDEISQNVLDMAESGPDAIYADELLLWGRMWDDARMAYAQDIEKCSMPMLALSTAVQRS